MNTASGGARLVPDGENAAMLNVHAFQAPTSGTLRQTLDGQTVQKDTSYELGVWVHTKGVEKFTLELRARAPGSNPQDYTPLARREFFSAAMGQTVWRRYAIRYESGPAPAAENLTLEVALSARREPEAQSSPGEGTGTGSEPQADETGTRDETREPPSDEAGQVWFDDVRLTKTATLPRNL